MTADLPPFLPPHVRLALTDAKAHLRTLYGDRLAGLVLYGSHARGDAGPDSDVDLLLVLRGPVRPYDEIRRTGPLALDLLLRHGADVAIQPYSEDDVRAAARPFLRRVAADGVAL